MKAVIQEEARYELLGEPGPFVVYEVDDGGGVISTAYYETHEEATEFANSISDDVRDDIANPPVEA